MMPEMQFVYFHFWNVYIFLPKLHKITQSHCCSLCSRASNIRKDINSGPFLPKAVETHKDELSSVTEHLLQEALPH